ncbi:ElyC/SanA/YdcF family protein [Arcobacter roscoffensis]|uniref:YdcF family protein n=1 Tax=Arcobacter roscoffensis TaxID=2961520 RepID=A0ABY5E8Y4_9BACT|nr:ElyC/SanA/YdcF family protein [Arcobacter roscoffensis]UTJ07178.1 YdcF family protein [Arcobacter roscoffensis]|tara:strand:+ start:100 stop:843 length:744 start_codon:yes stop_codon:yes gene_type:complete
MFFLKKFIAAFLLPMPIALFMFALGVYFLFKNSYTKAKIVLFFTISWLALLSFQPISNAILQPLEDSHKALIQTPDVKYVLVLGNGHASNENLSITSQVNMIAQNRLNEGIKHFNKLKDAKLIVSGYGGYDKNPHAFMQQLLANALGIKSEYILRLDTPRDTKEEAIKAKEIIKDEKFILVTSASHMKRAMLLFKKQGLNPIAAPTNHLVHEEKGFASYFSSRNLYKVEVAFHEYIGLLYSKIMGYI